MEKLAEVLHGVAKVGAMDCTGKAERFCIQQGVREFPGLMLVVAGEKTVFEGLAGKFHPVSMFFSPGCVGQALCSRAVVLILAGFEGY